MLPVKVVGLLLHQTLAFIEDNHVLARIRSTIPTHQSVIAVISTYTVLVPIWHLHLLTPK